MPRRYLWQLMKGLKFLQKITGWFFAWKNYVEGDYAYQNYLKHEKKFHPQKKILDRKSFLRQRQNEKWNKVNRCC